MVFLRSLILRLATGEFPQLNNLLLQAAIVDSFSNQMGLLQESNESKRRGRQLNFALACKGDK